MSPLTQTISIIVAMCGIATLFAWLLNRKLTQASKTQESLQTLTEWLSSSQQSIINLQSSLQATLQQSDKNVTDTLQHSYKQLNQRLDTNSQIISQLVKETGKITEISRSMQDLQTLLKSPKLRGNLGEKILTDLIAQMLPPNAYVTQYRFNTGEVVDAVIKTSAGLICIDAKFPLENFHQLSQADTNMTALYQKKFHQDIKKHVDDIATKYIRSQEGTLDFALMYIPSEAIYYHLMTQDPASYDYAQDHRVIPISPTTFYAFMQSILVSFETQKIATEAQKILASLRDIKKSAAEFDKKLTLTAKHLTNAHSNMTQLTTDFTHLNTSIRYTQQLNLPQSSTSKEA